MCIEVRTEEVSFIPFSFFGTILFFRTYPSLDTSKSFYYFSPSPSLDCCHKPFFKVSCCFASFLVFSNLVLDRNTNANHTKVIVVFCLPGLFVTPANPCRASTAQRRLSPPSMGLRIHGGLSTVPSSNGSRMDSHGRSLSRHGTMGRRRQQWWYQQ